MARPKAKELEKIPLNRRRHRKNKEVNGPENAVFSIDDNKKWFKNAVTRAGIKKFRWHDLRHTFISRLVQRGVNLRIVQEAAGHRTIAMTGRYAHLNKTDLSNAMALLNRSAHPVRHQQ